MAEPVEAGDALVVAVGRHACALPLRHVVETMRALPVGAMTGVPRFVIGVAIIRGVPTPVVDLGILVGLPATSGARHFVTLRLAERRVALAVDEVIGVQRIDFPSALPPLLANRAAVQAIGVLDSRLLMVLGDGWTLPDHVWPA